MIPFFIPRSEMLENFEFLGIFGKETNHGCCKICNEDHPRFAVPGRAGESGAALYKKYSFATVKPTAIDQTVFDVGASIGGHLAGTINDVTRNDEFDLAGE